jgi:hypothetical protein
MQEPKDGDFVAYIDALQRESAARLARQHVSVVDVAHPTKAPSATFGDQSASAPAPIAEQSPGHFVRRDRDAKLVKAIVACVIGAVFLLTWFGDGGLFPLIVGIALLGYALPRLLTAFRTQGQQSPASKALIDHVFGRPGAQTTKSGK